MEILTILTIGLCCLLLANEMPIGDTEFGGFPVAYYLVLSLLFIGFEMRKQIKNDRGREG